MPYRPPWRIYTAGDFFYGFSGARAKLIAQLTNGRTTQNIATSGEVAWLDQLLTGVVANSVNYQALNNEFAVFCRNDPKYAEVVDSTRPVEMPATGDDVGDNRLWRKKSKAGLAFLTSRVSIHFAIDHGMDWKGVIAKPGASAELAALPYKKDVYQYKVDDDTKFRVITFAELRFCYRKRADLNFSNSLQFWYADSSGHFKPGPPPWVVAPNIWKHYRPSNEEKEGEPDTSGINF